MGFLAWVLSAVLATAGGGADSEGDPGYTLYKEGYALILDERWDDARGAFDLLLRRHPRSEYADEAEYWSAYALGHLNARAATDAYRQFIRQRRESPYLDDALADLALLETRIAPAPPAPPRILFHGKQGEQVITVRIDQNLRRVERELKRQEIAIRRLRLPDRPPAPPPALVFDQPLDAESMIRIEALMAIAEPPGDERSFGTLKEVALDRRQKAGLRVAALEALSSFEAFDPFPVFVEVARRETSAILRSFAIDYIGERSHDRDRSIEALIELYRKAPRGRIHDRAALFYAIADVGNEKAVEFLADVARNEKEPELRGEAVYYLGSIGGEQARTALEAILRGR
jgi:hypothetical protein